MAGWWLAAQFSSCLICPPPSWPRPRLCSPTLLFSLFLALSQFLTFSLTFTFSRPPLQTFYCHLFTLHCLDFDRCFLLHTVYISHVDCLFCQLENECCCNINHHCIPFLLSLLTFLSFSLFSHYFICPSCLPNTHTYTHHTLPHLIPAPHFSSSSASAGRRPSGTGATA